MPRFKDETLSIRTSADIKQLLRQAAELERRSVASMVEVLVLEYARQHGLPTSAPLPPSRRPAAAAGGVAPAQGPSPHRPSL
ncbi:type II toxin -antitoxin system TacA 1-like antitoxin [Ideonella livida]|uniref:DUF1778 domain-containing protein n=1 Tax=Ideonella livida TaxID=2707176 RepID=A0A7C9TND0_9BURK|nr:DUF1778 domain-containing protein [Ideonella livida]NDY93127.1 DUF1778 domain-containing protein [Ideonella livida]